MKYNFINALTGTIYKTLTESNDIHYCPLPLSSPKSYLVIAILFNIWNPGFFATYNFSEEIYYSYIAAEEF